MHFSVQLMPTAKYLWTSASFYNKPTNPVWCSNGKPVENQYWTWENGTTPDQTPNGVMAVKLNTNGIAEMFLNASLSMYPYLCEPYN